jgi:hypothetical protein
VYTVPHGAVYALQDAAEKDDASGTEPDKSSRKVAVSLPDIQALLAETMRATVYIPGEV